MFAEFLNIVFSSLKLDKNLYRNNKNFGEAAIYFAGLIMILDGVAGAVAANTIIKTSTWEHLFLRFEIPCFLPFLEPDFIGTYGTLANLL